uniref:hypothetical protein n=1 Tax=Halomonas sp. TaxID=1486246 RepID=UPI00261E2D12|nr:hypothetical protein [Halomonas sp.]
MNNNNRDNNSSRGNKNKDILLGARPCWSWMEALLFVSVLGAVMASPDTQGQELGVLSHSTVIGGNALSHVTGVSASNMAAGDSNLQSNSGALAIGASAGTRHHLVQQVHIDERLAARRTDTVIRENAYQNASGWLSVNQAAGVGNVQSNAFGMAHGNRVSSLSDASLQQVLATRQGLGVESDGSGPQRTLEIEGTTFGRASGVIQVNQSAGTGNATRNSFSFQLNP